MPNAARAGWPAVDFLVSSTNIEYGTSKRSVLCTQLSCKLIAGVLSRSDSRIGGPL
jgi:hypothetical protein